MPELLLELFSEEIPARMQGRAAADLKRLVTDRLKGASLAFDRAEAFVTPRRLTLVVDGLPDKQPDVSEEKRGPRADAPEKAIQGFLNANGLTLDQCETRETDKGNFLFVVVESKGRATGDVLPEILAEVVAELGWPKSMRWGAGAMRWVRSLQRVLCLFDGREVTFGIQNDVPFGATTFGHRFHAPGEISVTGFDDYRTKLRDAFVVLDPAERREIIAAQAAAIAKDEKLAVRDDPGLLDEVAGLVEWPCVLMGEIDDAFMDVPAEVLITSMRTHQKYFALHDRKGELANRFLVVANMDAPEGGETRDNIIAGNERVLRARLSDAKFFWDQDRKRPLASRVAALEEMVFHAKLGSLEQKVTRIAALAAELVPFIPDCDIDEARSAATLAKADLTTEMVFEFPELQGVMGRYYALNDGEKETVANAVAEHYSPLGPNDTCPTAPVSVAVALADKIDTLVGFFAIDEKPTGSRDPFALRRAALGVIRLIIENGLRLPLHEAFRKAYWGYSEAVPEFEKALGDGHEPKILERELLDFFADRLKVHLREQGVRHDLISAVFALGDEDDLVRLLARVDALREFLESDDGENLLVAYRRAANIVRIEEKKDSTSYAPEPVKGAFEQDEERALHASLTESVEVSLTLLKDEDFGGAMSELARLRTPVDEFFDRVTVNADEPDLRQNRLRLLAAIGHTLGRVADFSKIEG